MTDMSDTYDEDYYLSLPAESGRIAAITRLLKLRGDEIVCEIGCAAGHFFAAIAHHFGHGTGIDTADAAIRAATHIKDKHDLQNIDFLKRLTSKNIVPQLEGHIAVRDQTQYVRLLEKAGFEVVRHKNLPHYRQPLRLVDSILLRIPLLGRLFASRLFVVAHKK